jgi:hypothetical protein
MPHLHIAKANQELGHSSRAQAPNQASSWTSYIHRKLLRICIELISAQSLSVPHAIAGSTAILDGYKKADCKLQEATRPSHFRESQILRPKMTRKSRAKGRGDRRNQLQVREASGQT